MKKMSKIQKATMFLFLVIIIVAAVFVVAKDNKANQDNDAIISTENEIVPTLQISIEDLQNNIKKYITSNEIKTLQIRDDKRETRKEIHLNEFYLSKNINVMSVEDVKKGKIRNTQIIFNNFKQSKENYSEMVVAYSTFISSVDPSLSQKETVHILEELGLLSNEIDLSDFKAEYENNNITYAFTSSKDLGTWLTLVPEGVKGNN